MSNDRTIPPLTRQAYVWPVLIAAGGFVAMAFATASFPIYSMLATTPSPGDPDWFPVAGALIGGGFWVLVAIGLFLWAAKKARGVLQNPQGTFTYTGSVTGLFILSGVLVLARNIWWLKETPVGTWTSTGGALHMMLISATALSVIPVFWASKLRLDGSGFGGPATIAAIVFLAHAYWPLAVVVLTVYLFVRKNEGPVVEA
jgi:hypothetical protein